MEDSEDIVVEKLKDRGLSCKALKSKIEQSLREAKEFRGYGFSHIAEAEEKIAERLEGLKKQVCKLR
jgi:hypothetical protein